MYPPKKRRSPFVHHLFAFAVIAFVVLFLFIWIAGSDDRSNEASDEVGETATKTVDLDAKTDDSKESKNSEPPKVGVVSPTDSKEADPPPGNDHLITGRVFSRDGSPIENTLVSLPGRPLRDFDERSDAAGAFSIELDREGFEDLLFAAEGYGTARRVSVPTGTRNLEIRLVPELRAGGRLVYHDGSGASGLLVEAITGLSLEPDAFSRAAALRRSRVPDAVATTDTEGRFELRGLRPSRYFLRASGPGARETLFPTMLHVDSEATEREWMIRRGELVEGRLVDGAGKPLADLEVRVRESTTAYRHQHKTRSDTSGRFRFDSLREGPWDLQVTPHGVFSGATLRRFSEEDLPLEVVVREALEIRGRVVNRSGSPISAARIRRADDRAVSGITSPYAHRISSTDQSGRFRFLVPPDRSITLLVGAPGFRRVPFDSLSDPANERTITLEASAVVAGRLLDARDRPVPKGMVYLRSANSPVPTMPGGTLEIVEIDESGAFRISIDYDPNVHVLSLIVRGVGLPKSVPRRLSLEEARDGAEDLILRMPDRARVEGFVRTVGPGSSPVGGIAVRLSTMNSGRELELELRPRTRADGSFTFAEVEPGEYSVRVDATDFAPIRTARFQVDAGKTAHVDVELEPAKMLDGRISDARGRGIPAATIDLIDTLRGQAPRGRRSAWTDPDGRFVVDSLGDGPYRVRVEARGYAPSEIAELYPTDTNADGPFEIVLSDLGSLRGRVVRFSDGDPVPTFRASLVSARASQKSFSTQGPWDVDDAAGRFELDGIADGDYVLRIRAAGFVDATRVVRVDDESVDFEHVLELRRGHSVEVRVTDGDGAPIPDARVQATRVRGTSRPSFDRTSRADRVTTTASGWATVSGLSTGRWVFEVHADGYPSRASRSLSLPKRVPVDRPVVLVQLTRGTTLRGLAVTRDGEPAPEATILLLGGRVPQTAVTDSRGAYEFRGLDAGKYRVRVSIPPTSPFAKMRASATIDIAAGESSIVRDLVLE